MNRIMLVFKNIVCMEPKKQRNSSTELFRILAMFLVVFVHVNGQELMQGHSIPLDTNGEGYFSFVNQYLTQGVFLHEYIQSLCRVCVNCFIIISGYYGIKLRFKSLWSLFLTVVCVQVPFAFVMYFQHPEDYGIVNIYHSFLGLSEHGYFVQCYVMLIFLSPILNSFVEKYGRKILKYVIAFVLIEGYVSMFRTDEIGFENGYRILHFILMYLVARCLYLYHEELSKVSNWWYLLIYFGGALILTFLFLIGFIQIGLYSSPLTIAMAIGLFMPFTKIIYYNKIINWIAGGTFTVFLINTTMPGSGLYIKLVNYLFDNFTIYHFYPLVFGAVVIIYILSVLYDKVARFVTMPLNNWVLKIVDNKFKNNILD